MRFFHRNPHQHGDHQPHPDHHPDRHPGGRRSGQRRGRGDDFRHMMAARFAAHGHEFAPHHHDFDGHEFGQRGMDHHHMGPRGHGPRGFGFDWDSERSEGRGRRQRFFDASELRLILLKLLGDQPRHGYDLIRAIEELTGGNYVPSAGVVYPALSVLQDLNFIESTGSDSARKAFSVTADGNTELAANADKIAELFARLAALAAPREGVNGMPIRRAMQNLRAVLQQRFEGETPKKTWLEIAAILDEAVQRIERLE